jgi:hypothetical protein
MGDERLSSWLDWYRFARRELDFTHLEAVVYANLRAALHPTRTARVLEPEG